MKVALGIEYNGQSFSGWQRQGHARSVQESCEGALSRVADHAVYLSCAGRTDAGVHAVKQVAHFSTSSTREPYCWVLGANTYLPRAISVLWASVVDEGFHARFSASTRTYRYYIKNGPARPAIHAGQLAWERHALELTPMRQAASFLAGEHDFSSFRSSSCQAKSAVRRIDVLDIVCSGPFIVVTVTANAFLHHMVRNIVGVLLSVGMGRHKPAWAAEVLQARDRTVAGVTACADGLYLYDVSYPAPYRFPPPEESCLLSSVCVAGPHRDEHERLCQAEP